MLSFENIYSGYSLISSVPMVTKRFLSIITICWNMLKFSAITSTAYNEQFLYYRPQRSWAKVMFLQVCVILFTRGGGVCLSACLDTTPPPPLRSRPPPGSRHQHTVNERPVRILLECILVIFFFTRSKRDQMQFMRRNTLVNLILRHNFIHFIHQISLLKL